MIGQTLGHYRVLEKIGEGGMGVVYRAHDERLDRSVALKFLPVGTLPDEPARKRFHKEALLLARLSHPNIGVIHDFDAQDGVDFLVMEYIAGTNLALKLAACSLAEKEVVGLGAQIAAALEEAHEHGVVHSDLKPGNVDGSGLQRVVPNHVLFLFDVSPDGKWLAAWEGLAVVLYSTDGAVRRMVCADCATAGGEDRGLMPPLVSWSRDGKLLYLHATETLHAIESRRTYQVSLQPGQMVPPLPDSGFRSIGDAARSLRGRVISEQRAFLSADPSVYAFLRRASHRNIFRVRVP